MIKSRRTGNRYLAGVVIAFSAAFFLVGTFGPPRHSPYYWMIVPLPAAIALVLGWRAWAADRERSTLLSASALVLLLLVLVFSHLLPRSTG